MRFDTTCRIISCHSLSLFWGTQATAVNVLRLTLLADDIGKWVELVLLLPL